MRVLVCGGRTYGVARGDAPADTRRANAEIAHMQAALDTLHAQHRFTSLIHGGAKGADTLAKLWAYRRRIPSQTYVAEWTRHGGAAGPMRNQRMLDEGRPDMVVAFPGGRGTADMVGRARMQGLKIVEFQS